MAHWWGVLPQDVMLEVQYEDVVEDIETQTRRILAHCSLEWDPPASTFTEPNGKCGRSMAQVRQPIYKSSVGR